LFITSSESRNLSTTRKWLSPPVGVPTIKLEIERIFRQLDQLRPCPGNALILSRKIEDSSMDVRKVLRFKKDMDQGLAWQDFYDPSSMSN